MGQTRRRQTRRTGRRDLNWEAEFQNKVFNSKGV